MTALLSTQDGSISDALMLWKNSLDKHFDGMEVCPICYSLFEASDKSLPKMQCSTCKNKFHNACMVRNFLKELKIEK